MKYIKNFKLFESVQTIYNGPLEDHDEDNLIARSDDWNLYTFNSLYEYVKLESRLVSENSVLTEGPFSHAAIKYKRGESLGDDIEGLNRLFKMYYDKFGKLYFLINMETAENYMFNAKEDENYFIFDRKLKPVLRTGGKISPEMIEIFQNLDFSSTEDELVIQNMISRNE